MKIAETLREYDTSTAPRTYTGFSGPHTSPGFGAARRDGGRAEPAFTQAIAEARRQGSRFHELRAATSLARLWRDQDRGAEARDLLAPIYGWFTEGFDTPDLKEAKALLDELV